MTGRIVFDLDGTLIDSAPDIRGVANAVLEAFGTEPITLAETRSFIGQGAPVFVQKMRAARAIPDSEQAAMLADFVARYDDAVDLTLPYPGVVAALAQLAAQHRLGICTNKPLSPCRAVLRHLGLQDRFQAVWGGDNPLARKPDPAPLHGTFDELGDGPRVYVGDSEVDAECARRAGVPFLLYTQGYRKAAVEDLPHHAAFDHFDALPDLVEALFSVHPTA